MWTRAAYQQEETSQGRGAPVLSEDMGWWGGDRKISGHLVAVSWEIQGGSGPGGRSWSRLDL